MKQYSLTSQKPFYDILIALLNTLSLISKKSRTDAHRSSQYYLCYIYSILFVTQLVSMIPEIHIRHTKRNRIGGMIKRRQDKMTV